MRALSSEIFWLTLTLVLTASLWIPYVLNRLIEHRPWPALRNPQPDLRPRAQWAERSMRAHVNAVENLVVFAPLVLAVQIAGAASSATASACMVYFFARLAHAPLYTFGVPVLRTIVFATGFVCQMVLAAALLTTA